MESSLPSHEALICGCWSCCRHDASVRNQALADAAHLPPTSLPPPGGCASWAESNGRWPSCRADRLAPMPGPRTDPRRSKLTLERQGHLDAFEARVRKTRRCSRCGVSPGPTLCWWCRWPTCRPTRPGQTAVHQKMPTRQRAAFSDQAGEVSPASWASASTSSNHAPDSTS